MTPKVPDEISSRSSSLTRSNVASESADSFGETLYRIFLDLIELRLPHLNDPNNFYDSKRVGHVVTKITSKFTTKILEIAEKVLHDINKGGKSKRQKAEENMQKLMHTLCIQFNASIGKIKFANPGMNHELLDKQLNAKRSKFVKEFSRKLESFDDDQFRNEQMNKFESKLDVVQLMVSNTNVNRTPNTRNPKRHHEQVSESSDRSRLLKRRRPNDLGPNHAKKQRSDTVPETGEEIVSSSSGSSDSASLICADCDRMEFRSYREWKEHNVKFHDSTPSSSCSDASMVRDLETVVSDDLTSPEHNLNLSENHGESVPQGGGESPRALVPIQSRTRNQLSPDQEVSQEENELRYIARPSKSREIPLNSDHVITQEEVNYGSWIRKKD